MKISTNTATITNGAASASNSRKNRDIDRISILPEVLLGHILSLLPTKEAVQTSVLSKAWKQFWRKITVLKINDCPSSVDLVDHFNHHTSFVDFVDQVFRSFENPVIQELYLFCYDRKNRPHIESWISEAVNRKAGGIYVHGEGDKSLIFRHDLFDCDSLLELIFRIHCSFIIPGSASFSSIRDLDFFRIEFNNKYFGSPEFRLEFPVLKWLKLEQCNFTRADAVNIDAPMLERFTLIDSAYRPGRPVETCLLKINGSRLAILELIMYSHVRLSLVNPSSVTRAKIWVSSILNSDQRLKMSFVGDDLLKQIANVRSLTLSYGTIEVAT